VTVDAGRNLTLTSEQDSDRYDSKQQSASAGGSFTFGSMTGSANVNVSRDKLHSAWQSVAEQTGIFAGQGGFDVTAGEHTQLNGAVIASTADASLNKLDTGTALIKESDMVITPDTSIVHIAAAWAKPLISVYKSLSNNNMWAPGYKEASHIIVHDEKISDAQNIPEIIFNEIIRRDLLGSQVFKMQKPVAVTELKESESVYDYFAHDRCIASGDQRC